MSKPFELPFKNVVLFSLRTIIAAFFYLILSSPASWDLSDLCLICTWLTVQVRSDLKVSNCVSLTDNQVLSFQDNVWYLCKALVSWGDGTLTFFVQHPLTRFIFNFLLIHPWLAGWLAKCLSSVYYLEGRRKPQWFSAEKIRRHF